MLKRVVPLLFLAGVAGAIVMGLPDIKRYLKLRAM
jgi:hypothetical protein